jgi:N-methylhydantoinase A/oxoprolinase/acetone carboxylase beta subunit
MELVVARARGAIRRLADRLKLDELQVAEGIVRIANANMERAIRVVSVQRGFDPRDFALLAFGGAGGMHACEIAGTLDIATVIVPRYAGVLSALGMLLADVTKDYSRTILIEEDQAHSDALEPLFDPMVRQATLDLRAEGFSDADIRVSQRLDVRYIGQSYEITVPFGPGYRHAFDAQHQRLYGYANTGRRIEVVNLRVVGTGLSRKPTLPTRAAGARLRPDADHAAPARFDGRQQTTRFYRWEALEPGSIAEGPAVIAGDHATAVIPPAFMFRVDEFGNLVSQRRRPGRAARPRARALAEAR